MNLSLTASSTGAQTVLDVQGEVDVHSAAQLPDRLSQIMAPASVRWWSI